MARNKPSSARELRERLKEDSSRQHQLELLSRHPVHRRKADTVARFADRLAEQEQTRSRTEALIFARNIALSGLPKRPTKKKMMSRDLRLGRSLWLRVSYHADQDADLPYGEDRFVLAAIQHLAISRNSPVVYFDRVGALLEMFGVSEGGKTIEMLRQRFNRLASFSIRLNFAPSQEELVEGASAERIFVIRRHRLPTRAELRAEQDNQMVLPMLPTGKDGLVSPYGVQLSGDFWEHLQDQQQHLIVPVDLLKLFVDSPTGWDYLCFLVARCGRAKSSTVVDHDILMGLFKEGREPDRNTIARLEKYHKLIMLATRGNLKASIEQIGHFPKEKGQRGRRKKRWGLKIHPSEPIVFSGKKQIS